MPASGAGPAARVGGAAAFDPPQHQRRLCQRKPQPDVGANQRRRADDGTLVQPHPSRAERGAARLRGRSAQGHRQGVDGPPGSADYRTDVDLRRRILLPQARRVLLPRQPRPRPGRRGFAPPPERTTASRGGRGWERAYCRSTAPISSSETCWPKASLEAPATAIHCPTTPYRSFQSSRCRNRSGKAVWSKDRTSSACSKPGRAITASCGIHSPSNSGKDRRRTFPVGLRHVAQCVIPNKGDPLSTGALVQEQSQRVAVGIGVRHLI